MFSLGFALPSLFLPGILATPSAVSEILGALGQRVLRLSRIGDVLGSFDLNGSVSGTLRSLFMVGDEVWVPISDWTVQRIEFDTAKRAQSLYAGLRSGTWLGEIVVVPEPHPVATSSTAVAVLLTLRAARARRRAPSVRSGLPGQARHC
jgi:hypothetical protein